MSALWRGAGLLQRLLVLVVLSSVAGVLVAGVALPVAAGIGVVARAGTEKFEDLPSELVTPRLSATSRFTTNDGKTVVASFYEQNRSYTKLKDISPWMQRAQIAIEDSRFYEHGGADLRGLLRAAVNNAGGGGTQGASTLTQQYVKLSLVYAAQQEGDEEAEREATEETIDRKLRELRYAIAIEEKWTKDQILERYLNIAYYGAGAYGVQAAAQRYFSIPAKDLNVVQAATLAGLVQRPNATDPLRFPKAAQSRRNMVLQRMADIGIGGMTQKAADRAKARPIGKYLKEKRPLQECEASREEWMWFCDYAKRAFLADPNFGRTAEQRYDRLYRGGLRVVTTLDETMQQAAYEGLRSWVYPTDEAAGVVTLVEPGTGKVKGIAISRDYGENKKKGQSKVNIALNNALSGSIGTQAGSTFKPFVAAAALEEGRGFNYAIYSPATLRNPPAVDTCNGPENAYATSGQDPRNETTSENGTYDLESAMASSINTYFLQLSADIGICEAATLAGKMGLKQANNGEPLQQVQSFTLGVNNVAPLDMAAAYGTFAARGKFCPAFAFEAWFDRAGRKKPLPYKPKCEQVLDREVADAMNHLLRGVVTGGSGARASISGHEVAGKTGTTNGRRQAWFMGYTTGLVGSVAIWNPNPPKEGYPLQNVEIGGDYYSQVQGANLPAPLWNDSVGAAIEAAELPEKDFVNPEGRFYSGGSWSPSFSSGNGYNPPSRGRDDDEGDEEPPAAGGGGRGGGGRGAGGGGAVESE